MKLLRTLALLLILPLFMIDGDAESFQNKATKAPNDWFFMQRAYPNAEINYDAYQDAFRQAQVVPRFITACEADYRGRKGFQNRPYSQGDYLLRAYHATAGIRARDLDLEGIDGPGVGERVRQARIEAISKLAV